MVRNFAAPPPFSRLLLAGILCLLAVTFAMEAKMAWYGPAAGPAGDIHAAKAKPADSGELAAENIPASDSNRALIPFAPLAALAAAHCVAAKRLPGHWTIAAAVHAPPRLQFYPQIFFRPPPAR